MHGAQRKKTQTAPIQTQQESLPKIRIMTAPPAMGRIRLPHQEKARMMQVPAKIRMRMALPDKTPEQGRTVDSTDKVDYI